MKKIFSKFTTHNNNIKSRVMHLIKKGDKLVTVVRKDLSSSYKIPQSIHSVVEFSLQFSEEYLNWNKYSNYLCCLEATSIQIENLLSDLDLLKIKYSVFLEPDIDNELTSITVEPISTQLHKRLYKHFKLANNGSNSQRTNNTTN